MIEKIFEYAKRPEVFKENSAKFWDDEHISLEMLKCHINPETDAASRRHDYINKSVEWICSTAPVDTFSKVIDLGCGPGMYTKRLAKKGYNVTGIDFSKRSIEYAKKEAAEEGLDIEYIYQNYLGIEYDNVYNIALMIYCDFGVLSYEDSLTLLKKAYNLLKAGGRFIFDVFTPKNYVGKEESNNWYMCEGSDFWRAEPHIALESHYIYDDNIRLDQYIIIDDNNGVEEYNNWDHYYTRETITELLEKAGFNKIMIYSDVAGKPYEEESKTMCVVVEK
jgi:SAM-dependent methyltransferase